MLAQLSFVDEVPTTDYDHSDLKAAASANSRGSGILGVFSGCFCLSLDQDDWFFDAVQDDGVYDNIAAASPASSSSSSSGATATAFAQPLDNSTIKKQSPSSSVLPRAPSAIPRGGGGYYDDEHHYSETIEVSASQSAFQIHHGSSSSSPQPPQQPDENSFRPLPPPPPPKELPLRFLRAGKGDPIEGRKRYEETLQWRRELDMDHILTTPHPNFEVIKKHYPHYYHLKGHNGEPVFFEQPPKTNLKAMREAGITLDGLLRHYAMVTEFQWQFIERDDMARSITVLDLEGMRMMDFVGECVEYVKKCSSFTGAHYPERAGYVLVINVPGWFQVIWKVVRPMVDEVTLKKINILRGKSEVLEALKEKMPLEHIPPEYGGTSMPLGESPEEVLMRDLMRHNVAVAAGDRSCGGRHAGCQFCSFVPARSY